MCYSIIIIFSYLTQFLNFSVKNAYLKIYYHLFVKMVDVKPLVNMKKITKKIPTKMVKSWGQRARWLDIYGPYVLLLLVDFPCKTALSNYFSIYSWEKSVFEQKSKCTKNSSFLFTHWCKFYFNWNGGFVDNYHT